MDRTTAPLAQHLLTRSDLAQLEIPAAEVLDWLARGRIEQIGRLPSDETSGEPIFTVLDTDLRSNLTSRLAGIGKEAVVLTPMRVRSFLMRALMRRGEHPAVDPAAPGQLDGAMADMLRDAAEGLSADVDAVLKVAREEALLEGTVRPVDPSCEDREEDRQADRGERAAESTQDADLDWFDDTAVNAELDLWPDDSEESLALAPTPGTQEPSRCTARATAAQPAGSGATCFLGSGPIAAAADGPPLAEVRQPAPQAVPDAQNWLGVADEVVSRAAPTPDADAARAEAADVPLAASTPSAIRLDDGYVQATLTDIRDLLAELAGRPPAAPVEVAKVDLQPLTAAVQASCDQASRLSGATITSLQALTTHLEAFRLSVEHCVSSRLSAALEQIESSASQRPPASSTSLRVERRTPVLLVAGSLLMCWAALLWFTTGSAEMALLTLIAANVIGCCALLPPTPRT